MWAPALIFTLAAAPAPLVVGSVRDQHGAPIAGALVQAGGAQTATAADGTFALEASGIAAVRITCAYCIPLDAPVSEDAPVIAIVRRHEALVFAAPTDRDLASIPYSRAESAASLRPFVVFTDSRTTLPGPRLSDRGALLQGGAIVDSGIPDYDIASNVSALRALPYYDLRSVTIEPAGQTTYHGDQAGGGVFALSDRPFTADAFALGGRDLALRAAASTPDAAIALSGSSSTLSGRSRGSADLTVPVGTDSLRFSLLGDAAGNKVGGVQITNSLAGFRAQFQRIRDTALNADIVIDRGRYDTFVSSLPLNASWNDTAADISLVSPGAIQLAGNFGFRESSGAYEAYAFSSFIAGTVRQVHLDVAAQSRGDRYSWEAGAGGYAIAVNGGSSGAVLPMSAATIVPWATFSYDLSPQWNYTASASRPFRLPTLLESYGINPVAGALAIDRQTQFVQTLTFTDLRRLKVAFTFLTERVTGLDSGMVRSTGVSLAWQIAPALSLRAWSLYFNDATQLTQPVVRFGRTVQSGTPGSLWLSYDNPGGARVDVIYRSDLLDALPDRHVDASISGPLNDRLRWFAATERRQDVRSVNAGFRFELP